MKKKKQPKQRDPNVAPMILRGGKGPHKKKPVKEICPECGKVMTKGICNCLEDLEV